MVVSIILFLGWLALGARSGVAEYQYYQSVKTLEPQVWERLGSPKFLKIPMVFVSAKGTKLLKDISNETVEHLALRHRIASAQFLTYVVLTLLFAIVFFKTA